MGLDTQKVAAYRYVVISLWNWFQSLWTFRYLSTTFSCGCIIQYLLTLHKDQA